MSTNKTSNFGLNQWEAGDRVLREEFNADNAKIDAALAKKGNCRVVTGQYVGTGAYNSTGAIRLTFDRQPLAILVSGGGRQFWAVYGAPYFPTILDSNSVTSVTASWSGTQVSWYSSYSAERQLNQKDVVYNYMALLSTD